ncbi:oligosaccharide flippase family protein [Sphingomonas sp.]|uniref:lipopolysaccharide biosynthesis protein n=1 Tax=Sphingomonas sp. TaxID=28214 RepID=UPI0031D23038
MAWILRQVAHLASGNATAVAIGMVTLALMAQMLGPALLGLLAMVEAYGRFVDQVVRLETWQAVIRYGSEALEAGDERRFVELVGFGVALDIVGALAAGAIALFAVPLVGDWIGWGAEARAMASFYVIAVAFGISSTPTGILRLFDRFALIAWIDPALALLRLAAVALVWALGGSVWDLLAIMIAVPCLQRVSLAFAAWRELRRRGYRCRPRFDALVDARRFPEIWPFILSANGAVLVRKSTQELDILAVGAVAGPIGAGIYQLVRKFTLTAMKAGAMLQQVVFPDLARLWARRELESFVAAIRQVELLTFSVAIAFVASAVFAGDTAIRLIAGPEFEDAAVPLIVQSVAALLFLAGSALRPALMTMGLQPKVFAIAIAAGLAFFAALYIATPALGVSGAGVAHIVFNLVWLLASLALFTRALRREHAALAAGPEAAAPGAALPPPVHG